MFCMLLGPGKKQTKKKIVPIRVVFIVCWENDLEAQERSLRSSKNNIGRSALTWDLE